MLMLLNLLGDKKWIILGIAVVAVSVGSFTAGHRTASNAYAAKELKNVRTLQAKLDEMQQKLRQTEREVLAAKADREVVTNEVIKRVPIYVNRGNCAITPDGLSKINSLRIDTTQ